MSWNRAKRATCNADRCDPTKPPSAGGAAFKADPRRRVALGLAMLLIATPGAVVLGAPEVVINEIMYHPASERAADEYLELYNRGAADADLGGWRLSRGVTFLFPSNTVLRAGGYLVVSASSAEFRATHPGVAQVVGDWEGILSNSGEEIELEDAQGRRVDLVPYADEGDWAIRRRGPLDGTNRDWIWYKEHDGLGQTLELLNPALPNEHGQNWAASLVTGGSPGAVNSVMSADIAPMILGVAHFPVVPASTETVTISARLVDETAGPLNVRLAWRVDANPPPAFSMVLMADDGVSGDGVAGDGLYGARVPALPNNTVVEFYVEAEDGEGNRRTWPAAAWPRTGTSPLLQEANALYQVDDSPANGYGGVPSRQPVYKIILTEFERANLASGSRNSDAQRNCTFISLDGTGTECRYLNGIRFRGHGSRGANPPNYRINLRSDTPWQGMAALNLNTREVLVQHLGAVLANHAGAVGPYSRAVQVRVNNANLAVSGSPMYGSYAANEPMNSEWAERHFPADSSGNIYKAIHDIAPGHMNYRGETPGAYRNTYFKLTNGSEDDWSDLIGMLAVMATNNVVPFTAANVREVINVEQWLRHMAVMNLFGNNESGLNTGNNDDYNMYRGVADPRFMLVYWDLDQILGRGGSSSGLNIFRATQRGDDRGWSFPVFDRLLHWPEFEPMYYRVLQELIETTFSAEQFDAIVDQTLGGYVDQTAIGSIKNWMNQRRSSVQSQIAGRVTPAPVDPVAVVSGEPRSPTPLSSATLSVGGEGITHYRYSLDGVSYGSESPVSVPLQLTGLVSGSVQRVYVIGRTAAGVWQGTASATVSRNWVVDTSWPAVRLNEVLARNDAAVNHAGTHPDLVELFNEGGAPVDLSGMRLSDDLAEPGRFVFPAGTSLGPGGYLVVYANNPDGTPGIHLGFGLNQESDAVYLFSAETSPRLLDAVVFGPQVADLSIGRFGGSGEWALAQPSPGATNAVQPLGNPRGLRINEWLAAGGGVAPDDFIELYNPALLPVALGGLHLTDLPFSLPGRHRIAPLCFVAPQGFVRFVADGSAAAGPAHLGFRLSAEMGEIALLGADLGRIDVVYYGPQQANVSQGRCPDGAPNVVSLALPTPGSGNACASAPPDPQRISLVPIEHVWRYDTSGTDWGEAWRQAGFDHASWPAGAGLLYDAPPRSYSLPYPVRTTLPQPSVVTYYFRTEFTVPAGLELTGLEFHHVIDDGAVFYLNGQEVGRFNLPGGTIVRTTLATGVNDSTEIGPVSIPLVHLVPGSNVLAVELHQNAPTSADACFGLRLEGLVITNSAGAAGVVLNEILANNATLAEPDGSTPDWVELYNPSSNAVDLAGMSLTDRVTELRRWSFAAPTVVPARGYWVVHFDGDQPASATNTGFGLSWSGDAVYLIGSPAEGGALLDYVPFGIQTADWSVGRVPDAGGDWQLTLATPGHPNQAAVMGEAAGLKVNEWMADPESGDDWFELYNPAPQPVALGGLYLTDDLADRTRHAMAALSFIGTGSNAFLKVVADGNVAAGADHVGFALRAAGEAIGLYAIGGDLIDGRTFGLQARGVSEGRLPDGGAAVVPFPESPTPAAANYLPYAGVVINEVLTHTDDPLEDAIELHNPTAETVEVGGWWLSDSRSTPQKFQIPPGTVLSPGGYRVFYELETFNNGDVAATPFALSSAGDEVYLHPVDAGNELNGYRAGERFGPAENGVSLGRHATTEGADFVALGARTFGRDNPGSVAEFRLGEGLPNAYAKVGPVVVSEIMYHPPDRVVGGVTNDNVIEEFIELINPTAVPVPLFDPAHPGNTWRLRNAVRHDFAPGLWLAPGGHLLVVSFDPETNGTARAQFEAAYGTNFMLAGPYAGKLDNSGESIELEKPDAPLTNGTVPYVLVERIRYRDAAPWPVSADGLGDSLQRLAAHQYGNEPTNWMAAAPAPGPAGTGEDPDGDGLPTAWELAHGLDPYDPADAAGDSDGDGLNNRDEYWAGTDPRSAASSLKAVVLQAESGRIIRFQAVAGRTYAVLYRTHPVSGPWIKLADFAARPADEAVDVLDDTAFDRQRFYRVATPGG